MFKVYTIKLVTPPPLGSLAHMVATIVYVNNLIFRFPFEVEGHPTRCYPCIGPVAGSREFWCGGTHFFWLSLSGNQKDTSHFGAPNFETPWVKIGRSGFSFGFLKPPPKGYKWPCPIGFPGRPWFKRDGGALDVFCQLTGTPCKPTWVPWLHLESCKQ